MYRLIDRRMLMAKSFVEMNILEYREKKKGKRSCRCMSRWVHV